MSSRRLGREQALQALYGIVVGHRDASDVLTEIVGSDPDAPHRTFVRDLVFGTLDFASSADDIIAPQLQGWTLERLPTIDRLLLQMGTFELRCRPETPAPVVINEAVELAKRFSTDESNRFVNGVLSAIAKETANS